MWFLFVCILVFKNTLLAEHGGDPSTWEVGAERSGFQDLSPL